MSVVVDFVLPLILANCLPLANTDEWKTDVGVE